MEMYLGNIFYFRMVLDNAKTAVVLHKKVKKIMGTTEKNTIDTLSQVDICNVVP